MSKSVIITLTTAGADTGPFDIYGNHDNYSVAIVTSIAKSTLLSGYTCNIVPDDATILRIKSNNNSCSNYINLNIPAPPTTTTTTTSAPVTTTTTTTPAPPTTTTTTTTASTPEVYFTGDTLSINNIGGKTYSVTFSYEINASCDNVGTNGQDPNNAITTFDISTNGGGSFTTIDSVSASVSGGNYPIEQSDSQTKTGTYTVNGITNPSNIVVNGSIQCNYGLNGQGGSVTITISSVTVSSGTANIICNDMWLLDCSGTYNPCSTSPTTTTTTTE